jgi:hypothetical protein
MSNIKLTWTDNCTGETGFSIERSLDGITYVEIAQVGAGVVTYIDISPVRGILYYRVRAFNGSYFTAYSNVVIAFHDYFLPSIDELNAIYTELHLYGIGNYHNDVTWSSSEYDSLNARLIQFGTGVATYDGKHNVDRYVIACRSFTSISPSYNLRDIGPAGGYIFWKSGNNYLEAAKNNQGTEHNEIWSNITNLLIGTTGTAIGTGQANTSAIIAQAGHIDSAAKLCNDLIIV